MSNARVAPIKLDASIEGWGCPSRVIYTRVARSIEDAARERDPEDWEAS